MNLISCLFLLLVLMVSTIGFASAADGDITRVSPVQNISISEGDSQVFSISVANSTGSVLQVPTIPTLSNNTSSIFSVSTPSNFNPLTDTMHTEGNIVIFTHYWTVEEVLNYLIPVWVLLFIILSFFSYRFCSKQISKRYNEN